MDTETDEGIRQREIENKLANRDFLTFDEMREYIELLRKKNIGVFKRMANSGWAWTNKEALYEMFKYILNDNAITKRFFVTLLEESDKLERAMKILNRKIEAAQNKANDLEMITSEWDEAISEFEVNRMRAYLDLMDKQALKKLGRWKETEEGENGDDT